MRCTIAKLLGVVGVVGAAASGWGCQPGQPVDPPGSRPAFAMTKIEAEPDRPRPPYAFVREDEWLLEQVQRGAFNYLWSAGDPSKPGHATGMVPDRTSKPTVSVAGVGFQLTGICIGVERGWITREQGRQRAELILGHLDKSATIRKGGLFYHFVDAQTAGQPPEAYERVVSTIDSALLFAGVLTASQYFGGEVQRLGDSIFAAADWKFFINDGTVDPSAKGFISLGWKPATLAEPTGEGTVLPYAWIDAGDEHRLVTFLAVCAPVEERRVAPELYYQLRRTLGTHGGSELVWFPWSGALFTAFFSHCWIDYNAVGLDDPEALGVNNRPRVDWWENSRRTASMHRDKCILNPHHYPGFGPNSWGLTASDVAKGYAVPGLFPQPAPMPGAVRHRDYASPAKPVKDDFGDGTIAPYGAGSCIMFDPATALGALWYYRELEKPDGTPLLWNDPRTGGYGFQDAFNLGTGWVAKDCLAIDQGPLLLAIENARSGFVWRTFGSHPFVKAGMERLKMDTRRRAR